MAVCGSVNDETAAEGECVVADVGNTLRQVDALETAAIVEGMIPNYGNTLRQGDALETVAA